MLDKFFEKFSDWAFAPLRLGLGVVFLLHGIGKLSAIGPFAGGISGTAGFFASLGIPAAMFFAWVVALVETFGGLFVLLGLFTRYAALTLLINMSVALILVHIPKGYAASEFAGLVWVCLLALLFSGEGKKLSLKI